MQNCIHSSAANRCLNYGAKPFKSRPKSFKGLKPQAGCDIRSPEASAIQHQAGQSHHSLSATQASPAVQPLSLPLSFSLPRNRQRRSVEASSSGRNQSDEALEADRTPSGEAKAQGAEVQRQNIGDFAAGDVINGQYRVVKVLGRGSNGVTYKAVSVGGKEDGQPVAVKALSLRGQGFDWKQLQLFEREARALESLSHPGIPRYIDYFEVDTDQDRGFFLVQELAEGRSLAEMVDGGWRCTEAEITALALQLLDTLTYLSSRRPPITHRDIKPENIVIEGGVAGGKMFLVDFGGVQAAAAGTRGIGTTMVGTSGYMAPEQFRGQAQPPSDLYGLGGTLLYLLSGRRPYEFEARGLTILYPNDLIRDSNLATVVEGLLQPMVEDRMSCEEASRQLRGERQLAPQTAGGDVDRRGVQKQKLQRNRQPAGSRVVLRRTANSLEVDIPPAGMTGDVMASGGFALVWNAFVAFWTVSAVTGGAVVMGLFSIPFWGAGYSMAKSVLGRSLMRENLKLGRKRWKLQRQLAPLGNRQPDWSSSRTKSSEGSLQDLSGARVVTTAYVNGGPQTQVELVEGVNKHVVGEGLDIVEQQWLVGQINEFLEATSGEPISIAAAETRVQDDGGALAEDAFDRRFDANSSFYVGPFGRADIDSPFREASNFDASMTRQRGGSLSELSRDSQAADDSQPSKGASRDESDSAR